MDAPLVCPVSIRSFEHEKLRLAILLVSSVICRERDCFLDI
ncbi:hypothetical protein [Paraburkholderia monticola]|nr:hypothetical protein [Paraburkholderia monticola]